MNPLLWKKVLEFKGNKSKIYIYILVPIIYMTLLMLLKVDFYKVVSYFSLSIILISTFIHYSPEDILFSESILATNISIKEIWYYNIFFIVILGFLYSTIILLVYALIYILSANLNITLFIHSVIQHFLNIIIAASLIGAATIHLADYSKLKQYVASAFSLALILFPIGFCILGSKIKVDILSMSLSTIISIVLYVICYLIVNRGNNELLIINSAKLVNIYNNNVIEE